ncbi:hypothetical protein BOTBODRAFT_32344 [Botryobasidium botryosum FD-172 SS1]|uniref:Protein kinase domain-containing protein n=1 Tax=Botryobasidium botryosum (strain FD-172 SS1) TaxID=930990 RepID=A0A067MRU7_BOTB1|nr:hypothetical protein BOTBODRAFT_32344 [Botryobasidium botryosum FD-172 SS1]
MVSPWVESGNIRSHLREYNDIDRLRVLCQTAQALKYLHEHNPQIIHGDLKAENILQTNDKNILLCDFGLATMAELRLSTESNMAGSPMYMAPELLNPSTDTDGARTAMSDVFAFGILAAVLFAGEFPFNLPNRMIGALILAIITGRRPNRPASANEHIWFLAEQCWQEDALLRPTMRAIYLCLSPFCKLDPVSMQHMYEMPSTRCDQAAYAAVLCQRELPSNGSISDPITIEVLFGSPHAGASNEHLIDYDSDFSFGFSYDSSHSPELEKKLSRRPSQAHLLWEADEDADEDACEAEDEDACEAEDEDACEGGLAYGETDGVSDLGLDFGELPESPIAAPEDEDDINEGPSTPVNILQAYLQRKALTILMHIAHALKEMHESEPPKVHGDVRQGCFRDSTSDELLWSMSKSADAITNLRWTAPELLNIDEAPVQTTAADIFAFGMTIAEVFTGDPPFGRHTYRSEGAILMAIVNGIRPPRPDNMRDGLWEIAQACWNHDPTSRPNIREVEDMLNKMV